MAFGLIGCVAFSGWTLAEVVLETRGLRVAIGDNAAVRSLAAMASGSEYAQTADDPKPIAVVYSQGRAFPATGAALANDKLTLTFAGSDVRAIYAVKQTRDYLAFELARVA